LTPERNSYFCKIHLNEDISLPFKINEETIYLDVRNILPSLPREYVNDTTTAHIHDCFVNQDDQILYLLKQNKKIFWLQEHDIPREKLRAFLSVWKISEERSMTETCCRVRKELDIPCTKKTRTKGVLLAVFNCGIVGAYKEIFSEESLTQVSMFFLELLDTTPKYIVYDNACHLEPFLKDHHKLGQARLLKLNDTKFIIDRLHIHNHVRQICKNFKCENYEDLKNINSVVCEETNFWLSGYKHIMKHMNSERFVFYLYIILECYNNEKLKLNKIKKFKD
jgi:hypothetical protein